jgi:hypothetical protein
MNRMLLAAAALACVAVADARADWGATPPVPAYPYSAPPAAETSNVDRFGWHPVIRKVLWWKMDGGSCKNCGKCKGCEPTPPPYGVYPNTPGTLVFPNHQFNRSPRDYFMWER